MNGQVRLAHDHLTDQHVAIKMVPRLGRENETQFLAREIQIILSVSHPNIVRTIDVFVRSRRIHFVMEYLAGGELFDFIAENTHFTEAHAATVMNDLLRALFYLHARGIAHRDVKLENLLCANQTWPLHVKLADFGFANYVNACAEPMLSSFVGTPYYIAPEMLRGDPHGRPVDVWASGVVLYILLSGKFPFGGSNEAEYYQRVLSKEAYFPDEEWSTISDEAKELVRGMLCKDPRKRFTTEQCLMHSWLSKAETHVPASVNCTERQQQQQQPAWHSCQSESQLFVQSVQPVEQEERQLQQQQQASHLEALDLEHTERSLQSPSLFRENVQKKGRWRRLGMVNQSLSSASPIENASCTTNQQNTTPEKKPSDNVPNSQHVVPTTTSATDSLNSRMQDVEVRDTPPVNRRPSLIRRLLSSGKLSLDRYEGRFPSFRGSFDDPSDEATAMPRKTLSLFAKDGPLRRSFHRVGEGRSGAVDDGINFVNSQSQRLPPKIARERLRQQRQVEASRKAARGTGLFSHRKVPAADYTGHGNAYHSSPRLQSYLPHPFQTVPVPAGQRGPTSSHSVIPGVKRYASPRRRGGNHDVWQFGQVPITRRDDSPLSSADDGVVRRTVSANVTMGERHLCNSGLVKIDYLSGKKRPTDDPLPRTAQVRV